MRFEILLIRNALCGQANELELSPDVLQYAIPPDIWRRWSSSVRDRAVYDFLRGHPPFQTVYDVSADGITLHHKPKDRVAGKPGVRTRKRTHAKSKQSLSPLLFKRSALSFASVAC